MLRHRMRNCCIARRRTTPEIGEAASQGALAAPQVRTSNGLTPSAPLRQHKKRKLECEAPTLFSNMWKAGWKRKTQGIKVDVGG